MQAADRIPATFTDLYELTMAAVYWAGQMNERATFELAVRELPPSRGYLVMCGVESTLEFLEQVRFDEPALAYLASLDLFEEPFLAMLETLRFTGDVWAIPEGEVAFAGEPLVRVTAPLIEAQLVETFLLNAVSYETMIATNAARISQACAGREWVDYSARRNHGIDASVRAARVARIGGAAGTSLVLAGQEFGLGLSGTMAHSFVMRFGDERDAFLSFARAFPGRAVILLDTYDTDDAASLLAELAEQLRAEGALPRGVRLDSGDLDSLSRSVRATLDRAGLGDLQILASGDLDEYRIEQLVAAGAPVDGFGVGTHLVAGPGSQLDAAYKLVEDATGPKLKLSPGKASLPGRKQVYRISDGDHCAYDVLALHDEVVAEGRPLLDQVMTNGTRTSAPETLEAAAKRREIAVGGLPSRTVALEPLPPPYEVRLTPALRTLRDRLRASHTRVPGNPA
jgi:nicotinate phosphoribosyltransferase